MLIINLVSTQPRSWANHKSQSLNKCWNHQGHLYVLMIHPWLIYAFFFFGSEFMFGILTKAFLFSLLGKKNSNHNPLSTYPKTQLNHPNYSQILTMINVSFNSLQSKSNQIIIIIIIKKGEVIWFLPPSSPITKTYFIFLLFLKWNSSNSLFFSFHLKRNKEKEKGFGGWKIQ